jgi:hypothetical protein
LRSTGRPDQFLGTGRLEDQDHDARAGCHRDREVIFEFVNLFEAAVAAPTGVFVVYEGG